jgi:hypothetical protein
VKNTLGGSLELAQIDVVLGKSSRHTNMVDTVLNSPTGATIGAAQLDSLYESAVLQRLQQANQAQPMGLVDLNSAAWEMRISKEYQKSVCAPVACEAR